MDDLPISSLLVLLVFLIILSAFFSGSETAIMTLNRYRLRHLAKLRHPGAMRASKLLERPDRFIGIILLGNTFVNIMAGSVATVIGLRLYDDMGIAVATGILTFMLLIFGEVAPKTLAAMHPEKLAFPATFFITPLLKLLYPLVWMINGITNGLLKSIGISTKEGVMQQLSQEELRTIVNEASALIPRRHQKMLLSILDLEKATVEDIMVPRNEIAGIDINDEWDNIVTALTSSQHTRLVLYRDTIDNIVGILHVRHILHLLGNEKLDKETLVKAISEPYFVPEGTGLNTQLLHFQHQKRRIGLVVNEYGDIQGLVTLEDILEEIVGEFTTDSSAIISDIHALENGTYLVDGSANIRALNRMMNWELPTDGPKTLNGLIIEYMESIPAPGTSLRIAGYPMEIVQISGNTVKTAKIYPALRKKQEEHHH